MHANQIQGCVVEQRVEKKRKIAESVWVHNQRWERTLTDRVWTGSVRVLTKVKVRFGSSSSQVQKICVRFGFGSYILSFEFGSVLYVT